MAWITVRMSGLSIPIPNAIVATITSVFPNWKSFCTRDRRSASSPAW